MPLYVSLVNWTDQGVRNVKDTIKRGDAVAAAAKKMGGSVRELLWTMGSYDAMAIFEMPDDQAASTLALSIGMQGNVRTVTMRAYTREEFAKIVAGL